MGITDHIWTFNDFLEYAAKKPLLTKCQSFCSVSPKLPEPSIVSIQLKDNIDRKILLLLYNNPKTKFSRSMICQHIKIPRTTVYDRLVILEDKTLTKKTIYRKNQTGRPLMACHFLWDRLSIVQHKSGKWFATVSIINR